MKRERDNMTKGQALYFVRRLKRMGKDAWHIRANDDTYVVYSTPAPRPIR